MPSTDLTQNKRDITTCLQTSTCTFWVLTVSMSKSHTLVFLNQQSAGSASLQIGLCWSANSAHLILHIGSVKEKGYRLQSSIVLTQIRKNSQSTYIQKLMPAEIWAICMWYLWQMPYVVPMHLNASFSSLSQRGAHFTENFWLHINILEGNSFKSLISAEYTKVSRCPQSQKSRRLRSGDYVLQLTWPLRPIHSSLKVLFRCCLTKYRKWGDAPSCMYHMCCHWGRGTCS
jgi:hypothetical protein